MSHVEQTLNNFGQIMKNIPNKFLKKALDEQEPIGVWLSGGADSALGLYMLQLYNVNNKITPIHGWDTKRKEEGQTFFSYNAADNVLNKLRELLPEKSHLLNPMHHFDYYKHIGEPKAKYHTPVEIELRKTHKYILNFVTGNPPIKLHPNQESKRDNRIPNIERPFSGVNKKWIKEKYDEYNLMETLYPLTVSCTHHYDYPCKKCFWCLEKHWAFGSYDGGII